MSEMCHLYSVTCHIVYIVKSYSKSFSFHHLSQKHTKTFEKMLLRIHPPNQDYLKAHSLYSNHFFRLVCSIAITTQKKESYCSLNVRCRCMSFICSVFFHQYMCSCFCGLASILAEDIKPRASCAEEVLGYAHISKGLSSVSVLLRASAFTECCRGRLLSSKDHMPICN